MTRSPRGMKSDLGPARARAYQTRFHAAWRATIEGILECGRVLAEARADLGHGAWLAFVENYLPIGVRAAQMLVAIAQDSRLANANHGSHLPPNWRTLYEISRLDDATLERLRERGAIVPELTRAGLKLALARLRHEDVPAPEPIESLAGGRYRAILADPPWPFDTWSDGGRDRSAEVHYPTLPIATIAALPVADLAAPDCMLFLWTQWPAIPEARGVIEAWGFRYATCGFVWRKTDGIGLGYYTRQDSEPCLLAVRGAPKRLNADVAQVIEAPRGRHSAKPPEVYARIERLVAGPYLELFARGAGRAGWDVWGNEADKADDKERTHDERP
ncbi:MAG: MT-A70 family methyltransferase [Kiloniellaceae bacterium]